MRLLVTVLMITAVALARETKPAAEPAATEEEKKEARCTATLTTASGTHVPSTICSGDLIFEDNFNHFDHHKWQHELTLGGGGNWEFQYYNNNRTNSYVRDGRLFITPSLLSDQYGDSFLTSGTLQVDGGGLVDRCTNSLWWGCERTGTNTNVLNPIKSARVRSLHSFRFKYGRLEVRAKMPAGDWIWPAIWMMPAFDEYGTWPASGEIDLTESRGNRQMLQNGVNIGVQQHASTLHYGPYPELNGYSRAHWTRNQVPGYNENFHRYQLMWTPDSLTFSVDDIVVGHVAPPQGGFWEYGQFGNAAPGILNPWRFGSRMAPFDQEFYVIMNVAIGGTNGYFPDNVVNPGGKPWINGWGVAQTDFWSGRATWLPTWNLGANDDASLQVDYVRIWAL